QVWVDLLVQGTGQKTEPLPCLDRGPGEDNAVDLLGQELLHRHRDREISLASAGRADPEGDGRGLDRLDVALLPHGLGADGAPARGEDRAGEDLLELAPVRAVVAEEVRG